MPVAARRSAYLHPAALPAKGGFKLNTQIRTAQSENRVQIKKYNRSRVQYAVIQVRQGHGSSERFVIAYLDERVLREFLAKPSIVATGFSSFDEATKRSELALGTSNLARGFSALADCYQLHILKTRPISRLSGRVAPLIVANNLVHIVRAALYKIQSRLTQAVRRLEPAVQQ